MARVHADSGAEIVAPSAMMDHQVGAIRNELDAAGHQEVGILSYSGEVCIGILRPIPQRCRRGTAIR